MGDYISEMTGDELQRNLRDAYGMTSALNREIEMLNSVRAKQAARIDDLEKLTGMMEQIRLHDEHTKALTAENAKLRAQLAEAVELLTEGFEISYEGAPDEYDLDEWYARTFKVLSDNNALSHSPEWYDLDPENTDPSSWDDTDKWIPDRW